VSNWKFVSLDILELLAFNAQKCTGSRDPGHALFSKNFRCHDGTFPRSKHAKFEVCIFSYFGAMLLALDAQKFTGSRDPSHTPVRNFFWDHVGLSLGACVPNLKFVSLVILELLAFNTQKFTRSRDPRHAPFTLF